MKVFSHVQEEYCIKCRHNVAIEKRHLETGEVIKTCLHKSCNGDNKPESCYRNYKF